MAPRPPIVIPRWIQLVGLPLLLLLAWAVAGAVRHAVFVFLVAAIVALLLDPLVRRVEAVPRVPVPRGLAVAVVYLGFAAVVAIAVVGLATVVVDRTTAAVDRIDAYLTSEDGRTGLTGAENDVERLQGWLDAHGLERVQVEEDARRWLDELGANDVTGWTQRALDVVEGAAISIATLLFSLVLVVVVSVYMLLDMRRLSAAAERRFPAHDGGPPLLERVERALVGYVSGQLLVSAIIGVSGGVGMWALGVLGWVPGADRYALVFGAWVALMELIPYLGPWLGAVPPALYALVVEPVSFVWVALLFLAIHQIEGHIVIPNVMGSALRLHPLLVIFGLLAGAEIYGLAGALVALPVLAASRALWEFFSDRIALEPWRDGRVTVEVEGDEHADAEALSPPRATAAR
jgi:predicted PurR-regulated permease PerM